MSLRRVAITGAGVVSPLAIGAREHYRRLYANETALAPAEPTWPYVSASPIVARIDGFDRRERIESRTLRKLLTTSAAYAVAAAGEALAQAGFESKAPELSACGVFAGSVSIDFNPEIFIPALRESLDKSGRIDETRFAQRGMMVLDPLFIVKTLPNGGVGGIAIEHQTTGPSLNIANGSTSGLQALDAASRAVALGDLEVVLAGGYDCLLTMDCVAEHAVANRLLDNTEPCRPFDRRRAGYALGEGAVFFVLEDAEHAAARGQPILGFVAGAGQATALEGAHGIDALARAARSALANAACSSAQIDLVIGDGVAVEADDCREAEVCRRVFDQGPVPFTAATANLGFTGTPSGPFGVLHALEVFRTGSAPALLGCTEPDAGCEMDLVVEPRALAAERILVWSSERGVSNAAVVIEAPP